jgi:hypothetical protein
VTPGATPSESLLDSLVALVFSLFAERRPRDFAHGAVEAARGFVMSSAASGSGRIASSNGKAMRRTCRSGPRDRVGDGHVIRRTQ